MTKLRPTDRLTSFLMPPSLDEWLPQRHLARFIVEVVDGLDLSAMSKSYRGSGSASYHPAVLLSLLVYGCATGVFSSRKLERATYDSVAFRFITANDHPDHDTIATFRRRFLKEIEALFVKVLLLAREMGVLKMGTVALDGTKIHANASRHSALSYEHAGKIEAQLKAEVADLLAKAEAADQADVPDGMSIPEELERREKRLETLASARATIETRAKERFEREQVEYQAKIAARDATIEATFAFGWRTPSVSECGTGKLGGKPPQPPVEGALPTDQINLTDEESRIMPVAGGGFEQCYNAQAVVVADSLLVVATNVVQATNDKRQLQPMLNKVVALPEVLGKAETLLADNGYFSAPNVAACEAVAVQPLIAMRREAHHPSPSERFADSPAQTDAGTRVRHHQIGTGLPAVPAARDRKGARRVEPCDHGLEPEADVHPLLRPLRRGEGLLPQNEGQRDRYRQSWRPIHADCRSIDGPATGKLTPEPAGNPSPTGC
jgi:transposase